MNYFVGWTEMRKPRSGRIRNTIRTIALAAIRKLGDAHSNIRVRERQDGSHGVHVDTFE
jgi:hypothetical protein